MLAPARQASNGREVGHELVKRQQGLRSVVPASLSLQRGKQLVNEGGARQGHPAAARRGEKDRQVLLLVLHRERGLELVEPLRGSIQLNREL